MTEGRVARECTQPNAPQFQSCVPQGRPAPLPASLPAPRLPAGMQRAEALSGGILSSARSRDGKYKAVASFAF